MLYMSLSSLLFFCQYKMKMKKENFNTCKKSWNKLSSLTAGGGGGIEKSVRDLIFQYINVNWKYQNPLRSTYQFSQTELLKNIEEVILKNTFT